MAKVETPASTAGQRAGAAARGWLDRSWGEGTWLGRNRAVVIPYGLICLLLIVAALKTPNFVSASNLREQLVLASYLGTIAAGETLVILTGGIDLSVAWNLNFAAILLTQTAKGSTNPAILTRAALLCLVSATLVGFLNGLGVAYLRIPSLVMTLGMNAVLAGYTLVYTNGSPQGAAPTWAKQLATGRIGGVLPWALVYWAALSAALIFLLRRTVYGRRLYAVGNNPQAAFLSGVPVRGVRVAAYTLCGLGAGLGAFLLTGYSAQSYLGMGDAYVLQSIAAVVIGGTSILGGAGGYGGTIAGAITVVLLQNTLQVIGLRPAGQNILYGLIVLLMLFVYGRSGKVRE